MDALNIAETGARPNRRALAKAATTQKVLDAARRLFEADGYEKATMRGIAREAGMSTGSIFANYDNKAQLYLAAYGHLPISPELVRELLLAAKLLMAIQRADPNWSDMSDEYPAVVNMDAAIAEAESRSC